MKELVARGRALAGGALGEAMAMRAELASAFATEMEGHDAVLTLPALGEAPLLGQGTGNPAPCVLWTLLGVPALTLPRAFGTGNLPLGLQLVGAVGADHDLLSIAAWCSHA